MSRARRARPGGLAGGARGGRLRPLPRRAGAPHRAAPPLRRLLHGLRAPLRRAARRLRARHDDGARCGRCSPSCATALVPLLADVRQPAPAATAARSAARTRSSTSARAVMDILEGIGFDPDGWRLDVAPHPFAQAIGARRRPHHHALRPARLRRRASSARCTSSGTGSTRPASPRGSRARPLGEPVSLGVHESQSRLWENLVGRSRAVLRLGAAAPARDLPGALADVDADDVYRGVNRSSRRLIRVEADETTYNLHILAALRARAGADRGQRCRRRPARRVERGHAPAARARGARRRAGRAAGRALGRRADRLLPDLHARQPDGRAAVGARCARRSRTSTRRSRAGDFAPLRDWLPSTSTATAASCRRPSCCSA